MLHVLPPYTTARSQALSDATMPARLTFALLLIAVHAALGGVITTDEMTPEQLERQRLTESALVDAEQESLMPRPKRRHAPNGDTLDAQDFLESMGQSTLRCSACELVAVKFEKAIDAELVAGWAGNTSVERATALRTTLPKRACAKMKRMAIAMEGEEAALKYVDLTKGTEADLVAGDFGAMGLQHRETVRTLYSNPHPSPHPSPHPNPHPHPSPHPHQHPDPDPNPN